MQLHRHLWLSGVLGLAAGAAACAQAGEVNAWPFYVARASADAPGTSEAVLGPLVFREPRSDGRVSGFRPFYLRQEVPAENKVTHRLLFPFFNWEFQGPNTRFSFFSLINYERRPEPPLTPAAVAGGAPAPVAWRAFDAWPFYFSRRDGNPETSYRALLPLGGTIKNRFGNDRIDFVLLPLWSRWQRGERVETDVLWPIFKSVRGGGERGFDFWPLYGTREKAGGARRQFALWPLYLDSTRPVEGGTDRFRAVLPFYALRTTPTRRDASYLLFFGATHDTAAQYDETRYFWPLAVQATGPQGQFTNRWAPVYSHSYRKGTDKTWVLWPAYRRETWNADGLAQAKTQFLFFVYWDLQQRDPQRPAAGRARKTHLWPLVSAWDNGAGRKQFQLFSPFEVFFPRNENVRTLWSPLVAVYRSDRRGPDQVNTSFLFDLVTYRRTDAAWRLTLGPLARFERRDGRTRLALLPALFSRKPAAATAVAHHSP